MQSQKESRAFLQKLLQSPISLPFEPTLLPTLFTITRENSNAPMGQLVDLIEHSQKLATRVLAIANSASYGLSYKVSTLHHAVSILGVREIRLLAVLVGMASIIQEVKLPKDFDIITLWKHQLKTAAIARALATELGGPSGLCGPSAKEEDRLGMAPDEAYAAGLLHDIGKILFAAASPDTWEAVEASWDKEGQQYFEAENAYWGLDHALIGAEMLHHWKLPLLLTDPINWHHAPELASTYKMGARLLAAANIIAHDTHNGEHGLCERAVALLPKGVDAFALELSVIQSLANADSDSLAALIK